MHHVVVTDFSFVVSQFCVGIVGQAHEHKASHICACCCCLRPTDRQRAAERACSVVCFATTAPPSAPQLHFEQVHCPRLSRLLPSSLTHAPTAGVCIGCEWHRDRPAWVRAVGKAVAELHTAAVVQSAWQLTCHLTGPGGWGVQVRALRNRQQMRRWWRQVWQLHANVAAEMARVAVGCA